MRRLWVFLSIFVGLTGPAWAQSTRTDGTLTALNKCVELDVSGMGTASYDLTGTWSGTVTFSVVGEGGTANSLDVAKADTPGTTVNTSTSNGVWSGPVAGYHFTRACMTSYSSGTAYVALRAAATGGGSGGGAGGGAGTSDTTEATQLNVLAAVDGLEGGVGAAADAAATQGSTGSISAKLRTVTSQLNSIDTKLATIDDIVSGAGVNITQLGGSAIAANSGAVTAGTQRVVHASDDPAVTSLGLLDNAANQTPADNYSNPTGAIVVWSLNGCWDGSAWDRCPTSTGGSGTVDSNTTRTIEASDSTLTTNTTSILTSTQLIDDTIFADEAAFTYATSKVQAMGAVAESTSDALADGTVGAPNMTLDRKLWVQPRGYLSGGAVPVTMKSDNTNNDDKTAICTGPCTVYSITAFNHAAAAAFLRCENDTSANTTPGSETASDGEPDFEIPGNTTGAGFTVSFPVGISYATALTCWIATGEASSDNTDAAQDDVTVMFSRVQ